MLGPHIVSGSEIGCFSCPNDFSGRACGNDRAIPPWMGFTEDPDKYFGADQVPNGFKLVDPSKMKDPQIKEILKFWYSKQEASGFGFKCLQDDRSIGKKRARVDSDSDSDADSDVNSEAKMSRYPSTRASRSKSKGKGKWWRDLKTGGLIILFQTPDGRNERLSQRVRMRTREKCLTLHRSIRWSHRKRKIYRVGDNRKQGQASQLSRSPIVPWRQPSD